MTPQEFIISELGNITFRIETNLSTLRGRIARNELSLYYNQPLIDSLFDDVEKLKYLKKKLEIWTP